MSKYRALPAEPDMPTVRVIERARRTMADLSSHRGFPCSCSALQVVVADLLRTSHQYRFAGVHEL